MKFDVVIGNPPYNRGMDIDFINLGYDLSTKYTAMIVPAKWQTADADQRIASKMSYGEFRRKLVPHMSHVVFYPCCKDVFDILQVDGITYFLLDKEKHEKCEVENRANHIPAFNSKETRDIRSRQSLVNIGNEIMEYLGNYKPFTFPVQTNRKRYQVWTNTQLPGGGFSTLEAPRPTQIVGESTIEEYLGVGFEHSTASTCSFSSDNKAECESFISWLNSKFTRFFVAINISKLTGVITNDCFRFVPIPSPDTKGTEYGQTEFTWDHIYTDKELYEYYKLPQKYISVIESIIKERK